MKGTALIDEPLGLPQSLVRAESDVLGHSINSAGTARQRTTQSIPGTGIAGASSAVSVSAVHTSMMAGRIGTMKQHRRREHTDRIRLGGSALPVISPARLYVCGITPYDVTHLGHAHTFVWADALAAVLRLAGAETVTCRNVTDVDDVLTRAAQRLGRHFDEFALEQEFLFGRDMAALRVRRPEYEPRARHHVERVVQLALALLARGHAYQRNGTVYFRGSDVLAKTGLTLERATELATEFGDQPDDQIREEPFDVPVWRPSADEAPGWPSPWGRGRPGWHAECAAIALGVLGPAVDVLAGGADLTFPHHAYQAAMLEAATGVGPFARAEFPVGMVTADGAKMAKSVGNLVLVSELLDHHPAAVVRLLLLNRPWRASWNFSAADIADQANQLDRLYSAAGTARTSFTATEAITAALVNDLDVPTALAIGEESGGDAARLVLRTLALE
jgi:cysteinyl-tRNA synthetase